MSICYTGSNRLVCALSFDSQLSCVFLLIKCIPIFSYVFPFSSFADSIINFPSPSGPTSQKRHLKPIHRWCSGTNQSTAWIATWNQPARLPHIPCRPCKALGTSQTNLLCSRKNQQHEPSHQWTCCSPQKRIVCVPPCIKSQQHPNLFPTSPLGQYCEGSLLLNFGGQKRSSAFRRICPSAALGKLLKLTNQAICISRCRNRCSFAL